jgi:GNAT superfamily N-acetyltransferase
MDFILRESKVADLPSVLELINELNAIVNKKEKKLIIDIYDLIRDGFSLNLKFKLFVAEVEDLIVGFALFYKSYSPNGRSMILEDVFVSKGYKKLGISISLFAKFLDFAKNNNIKRIEWGILSQYKNLIELYKRAGAQILTDRSLYTIDHKSIYDVLQKNVNTKLDSEVYKNYQIRKGVKSDMPAVINMIKSIAIYKKTTCDITIKDLLKDGFLKNPFFGTFVLEVNKKVVGVVLYYDSYATFRGKSLIIEGIHIERAYRGYGFGKLLIIEFLKFAQKNKIKRIEQLIYNFDINANNRIKYFGAKRKKDIEVVRIGYEALHKFVNNA